MAVSHEVEMNELRWSSGGIFLVRSEYLEFGVYNNKADC